MKNLKIKEDLVSVCTTRTILHLSCENCICYDNDCARFKKRHNGVTPYEYTHSLDEEREEKKNEEV